MVLSRSARLGCHTRHAKEAKEVRFARDKQTLHGKPRASVRFRACTIDAESKRDVRGELRR